MTIDNEGYLSNEIEEIQKEIVKRSREYFDLAEKVNKHAHSLKFKLDIHNQNAQEVTSAPIFVSILESFNSIYILSSKGLVSDSKIILRSMLEKTIKLKYIFLDYENAFNYLRQSELDRLKLMNVVLNDKLGTFSETVKKGFSQQDRDLLQKQIENEQIPKPSTIEYLAKKTEMLVYYNNVYRLLSDDVHTNSRSIDRYFHTNDAGNIIQLNWFSSFNENTSDINMVMFTAIALLISSIETINELFSIKDKTIDSYLKEINILAESIKS